MQICSNWPATENTSPENVRFGSVLYICLLCALLARALWKHNFASSLSRSSSLTSHCAKSYIKDDDLGFNESMEGERERKEYFGQTEHEHKEDIRLFGDGLAAG